MKKKGEAHMEEKPKVKAKRKWTVVLIFILILGTIAAILAINRPIHSKKIREKKKAEVQIDTSQFTADSLQGLTASVSNLEAVKGYHPDASLNQITHDTNVIKKLEADISKVDFDTPGTYDITYNVRYGWIWNGVRDLEYAYSHVILSYTYAKYALHNNSQANYAFYGLPNSTKKHLINKANQMQAMGGIPSGYAVYYFNTSYNHQPMAFQVNNVATLSLRKSSSNTDITNGNSCYSLANAKYGVYSNAACTSQVSTFTTNANGTSNSINLEPGTYYVKEISAPEGYYIDNTVKTVSLSSGENKVVSFTDKPMDDPAAIVIQKKDKYTSVFA